ncbi:hypothetical protein C8R43DRAFT_439225 [Mycena crocata]|nr:hypothetical protein C8R43DRAFT_439225 [Mycena crocata]
MPALRRLRIAPPPDVWSSHQYDFLAHLAGRSPFLEELDMFLTGLAPESVSEALRALPGLRTLAVTDDIILPPLTTAKTLLVLLEDGAVCPELCSLRVRKCTTFNNADLQTFAERRLASTAMLGAERASDSSHERRASADGFKELDVHVEYGHGSKRCSCYPFRERCASLWQRKNCGSQ